MLGAGYEDKEYHRGTAVGPVRFRSDVLLVNPLTDELFKQIVEDCNKLTPWLVVSLSN